MATAGHALDTMSHMTRFGALARSQGYATLFVQPAARHAWRYDSVVASLGFEDYYSAGDIPLRRDYPDPDASSTGWDYDMLMFALDKIDALGEPFVAGLVTGTSHKPFPDPGPPFRGARPAAPNSEEAFLATLRYSDWALGEFMRAARTRPWFEHTAFVLFADHGVHRLPGLGIQAATMRERNHIPMLIYFPAGLDAGETDVIASQLDILPTLMDLAGFSERYAALGESLMQRRSGWAFVSDASGGNGIGLIADDGFVRHDLRRRLEAGGNDDPAVMDRLERSLLALDAAVYHAIRNNHWLRPDGSD
jgi:phosphoglycerol transferase MdoB-like AlkP superfamily enzyme